MYDWLTHTWNTVKGKCPHGCHYCYMKRWGEQPILHFDEKELKIDLGEGNFIFVGSSCDMFANEIPLEWITETLTHCAGFNNTYLLQSKNPERLYSLKRFFPESVVLGTTIETNRIFKEMCNSPSPANRAWWMSILRSYKTMVTIEPIMNFDIDEFSTMIIACNPQWVNIGANTNSKVKLPEPSPEKIKALIDRLKNITEVKIKPNLKRLMVSVE